MSMQIAFRDRETPVTQWNQTHALVLSPVATHAESAETQVFTTIGKGRKMGQPRLESGRAVPMMSVKVGSFADIRVQN
jgi:hypothetical protein